MESNYTHWTVCKECRGRGKKRQRIRKKDRLLYQKALDQFEKSNQKGLAPAAPKGELIKCKNCEGSGLKISTTAVPVDEKSFPHVAIIGGGIGGTALAVACLHRGIPFTLFERDESFNDRSQGYGLTLQQASKAMKGLGIVSLKKGIVSTRHLVHSTDGKVVAEWGMRKWVQSNRKTTPKKTNIHIARQALRAALMTQLKGNKNVKWGHQFIDFDCTFDFNKKEETNNNAINLSFKVNGKVKNYSTDLVVGADGIRSTVRKLLIGDECTPLRYLDCIVILGICSLKSLKEIDNTLLDSTTVFQTANGNERIYVMPFDKDSVMWQLSFPMTENAAKELSTKGAKALKKEAVKRTPWHAPVPQIIEATPTECVSGYPVYDRELLNPIWLQKQITLIGDAAHPMSPFKGQGANQALLDALALARIIFAQCDSYSTWKKDGIRNCALNDFEAEMIKRSAIKVQDSAAAADFLHSDIVLKKINRPRGK